MTPWRDCAPCHSQPDGARLPLTRHPAYGTSPPTRANSVREGHSLPTACRIPPAMAARPPSSCRCGCLAPPSSPSIGIWLGPFAFPYPSSMVSTTRTSRFGGFGLSENHLLPELRRPDRRDVGRGVLRAVRQRPFPGKRCPAACCAGAAATPPARQRRRRFATVVSGRPMPRGAPALGVVRTMPVL